MYDASGFFVRFAPPGGGIFLDCTVHDIDLARWLLGNPKPVRVFATGVVAIHEGLREFGDVDNGIATCEFADGKMACFYASRTMAHGHETLTEIFGSAGRLTVGQNPRLNRVDISAAHGVRNECTPTFYERFEAAFLREVPPFALAALRFFFAAVPLVFFIKRPQMPWRYIAGYGFAIGVCQFGLLFLGMKLGMPAGLSSIVIQVQVFFTIGLGVAFLGDGVQRHNLIGAAISTIGIVVLAAYKIASGASTTFVGFVLVIIAAFAWAVGNVIAKRAAGAHDDDMLALVVWS